ncbi:MAG: hypothetical protein ACLFTR_03430 [Candidatus Woesearchaeota archaeon]
MSDFRVSSFMMALVGFSAIIALMTGLLVHTASRNDIEYNEESLDEYDRMEEMSSLSRELRDQDQNVTAGSDFDLLGDIFSQSRTTLRVTQSSIDTFDDMTEEATKDVNVGYSGRILRNTVLTILIMAFVFLMIMIAVKWRV